jgi:threonine dehydratase
VWLKREDLHELGSFKWRGAVPALAAFRDAGADAVVTASTGNHGAATAWAAARLGMRAVVFGPERTSETKLARMRDLGADVRLTGPDLDVAKDAARAYAREQRLPFFEDGAEPAQFAGYGAIARELLEQLPGEPRAVIVPVGNGALFAGIGAELRGRSPTTRRIAVVADAAPVMALSHEAGRPVECESGDTFADGMAVRVAVPLAVEVLADLVDEYVRVSERDIARAVGDFARAGIRVEGAAATPLAALDELEEGGPVVLIVTGANIDDELYRRAVERPDSFAA